MTRATDGRTNHRKPIAGCLLPLAARHRVVLGHQAGFTAGGVVAMNHTLAGDPIEHADGVAHGGRGLFDLTSLNGKFRLLHVRSGPGSERSISQPFLLIDQDSLL